MLFQTYLKGLSRSRNSAPSWDKYGDVSNLSDELDEPRSLTVGATSPTAGSGNRFLKAAAAPAPDSTEPERAVGQRAGSGRSDRLLTTAARFTSKQAARRDNRFELSDEDLSLNEELLAELQAERKQNKRLNTG